MPRRIDAKTRAKIVEMYLSDENATYAEIGRHFGINQYTIRNIVKRELQAGNGIVPDRRSKPAQQPDWMEHVTPLHQHKMELEQKVEHKQAELDAAKQELRDFTATLKQLMEDTA